MTLTALIRKRESAKVATAIPAIPAIQPGERAVTVAKIATVAVANPTETKTAPITDEEERVIRAWLAHIEETNPVFISEVVEKCQWDTEARAYLLRLFEEAQKPKPEIPLPTRCGDCAHFERINHQHLGHCSKGEPEAIAGLWDSHRRYCEKYLLIQHGANYDA